MVDRWKKNCARKESLGSFFISGLQINSTCVTCAWFHVQSALCTVETSPGGVDRVRSRDRETARDERRVPEVIQKIKKHLMKIEATKGEISPIRSESVNSFLYVNRKKTVRDTVHN